MIRSPLQEMNRNSRVDQNDDAKNNPIKGPNENEPVKPKAKSSSSVSGGVKAEGVAYRAGKDSFGPAKLSNTKLSDL